MLGLSLVALLLASPSTPGSPIGKCDPVGGPRLKWTKAQRQEARERALDSLRERGARPVFIAYVDAVIVRESSAAASRWHDKGTGLGLGGINVTTHAHRWPAPLVPALCTPEISAAVIQDIADDILRRHKAATVWELQAGYAGRFECIGDGRGGVCTGAMQDRTTSAICSRIERRGFDCYARITRKDLGRRLTRRERLEMTP